MAASDTLSLGEKVLVAAGSLTQGDVSHDFTAEDLVVAAWKQDHLAFGLRGHEASHPDSNKVYTKLDGQTGLVAKRWLAKSGDRTLRITQAGLARVVELHGGKESELQAKLDRMLQESVSRILSHTEFQSWIRDPTKPNKFRSAGHFWGIAPGTPSSVVRSRVLETERTLETALKVLNARGLDGVVRQRGQALFDRQDIERALAFQQMLRERFRSDLKVLDPEMNY